jgi:nitronate monooxygenase
MSSMMRLAASQRPERPIFSPVAPVDGGPDSLIEAGALYAGESVARISDLRPAGRLTRELATS